MSRQHPLFHCTKVTDPKIRKVLIFKNRLCFICFDNLHTLQNVPQVTVVKNPKVVTIFRFVQKILRMIIKAATEVKIVDTVKIKTHIKMIIKNNYFCEYLNNILLQTTCTDIVSTENGCSKKVHTLFDSGAQRSYITKELQKRLNLKSLKGSNTR